MKFARGATRVQSRPARAETLALGRRQIAGLRGAELFRPQIQPFPTPLIHKIAGDASAFVPRNRRSWGQSWG